MKRYWKIVSWSCLGATVIGATTLATVFAIPNKQQGNVEVATSTSGNASIPTAPLNDTKANQFSQFLKHTSQKQVISMLPDVVTSSMNANFFANGMTKSIENNKKEKEIYQYSVKLVHEIYAGKINVPTRINELKEKYDDKLSWSQLDYLQQKISLKNNEELKVNNSIIKNNQERMLLQNGNLFYNYYQPIIQNTIYKTHTKIQNYKNLLTTDSNAMLAFAILSTAASVASLATSIAIACIPFWGWVEVGFAIAATGVDIAASYCAWNAYEAVKNINNKVQDALNTTTDCLEVPAGAGILYDLSNCLSDIFKTGNLGDLITRVIISLTSDAATNSLAVAAEPDVTAWYVPLIDTITLTMDSLNLSVCTASIFMSQTISQLQKEITKLEDNARD